MIKKLDKILSKISKRYREAIAMLIAIFIILFVIFPILSWIFNKSILLFCVLVGIPTIYYAISQRKKVDENSKT